VQLVIQVVLHVRISVIQSKWRNLAHVIEKPYIFEKLHLSSLQLTM